MITPFFKLRQDEDAVTVEIRAPNANIRDTEIEFFERTFCFSAVPYFLRLYLPGDVRQDEGKTTKYDAETGTFTIEMLKRTKGEFFPRLEMLSELIKPQRPSAAKLVLARQELPDEADERQTDETLRKFGYGFGWRRHGILAKFSAELRELFDLAAADTIEIDDRLAKLEALDVDAFSSEHYLADLFDPTPELTAALELEIPPAEFELNDEDRLQLKDLRVVRLPELSEQEREQAAFSMVDVLFSFLFDLRITDLEHNACSDAMIGKLSPSLSGLAALQSSTAFFRLHSRFNNSGQDFTYLYNQLFIDDYALFIQSMDEELLQRVTADLKTALAELKRADIAGLDLEYVETEAKMIRLAVEAGEYDSDDE
ncbi:Protein SHQ1-like protein [Aphelenchoides fujianensis]|nr:Protein SHQ1-like protein [Aphelenchoides fujianensis]